MDIGTHYKYLDNIDVTELFSILNNSLFERWDFDCIEESLHKVHKDTKTMVLRFTSDKTLDFKRYEKHFPEMDMLKPILEHISSFYDNGGFIRILIARLPAGKQVGEHIDEGYIYEVCNRVHLAIDTNDDVSFYVDGIVVPFKNGDIVEVNNCWKHSVDNKSNSDRIHLIMDYITDKNRVKFNKLS